jgi:hypothetical protein
MSRATLTQAFSTGMDWKTINVSGVDFMVFYHGDLIGYIFDGGANVTTYLSEAYRQQIRAAIS